jgi:hypothetical protein
LQHRITRLSQMLDILNELSGPAIPFQKTLRAFFTLGQRQAPQILTFRMENLGHEIREIL